MGKALAGVKYGKLTSKQKPRTYGGTGSGRSGPPMVSIGNQSGRSATPHKFAKTGSVSQQSSHAGPSSRPTIGKQSGHGGFAAHGIRKS
jgi:hypothetical protein